MEILAHITLSPKTDAHSLQGNELLSYTTEQVMKECGKTSFLKIRELFCIHGWISKYIKCLKGI